MRVLCYQTHFIVVRNKILDQQNIIFVGLLFRDLTILCVNQANLNVGLQHAYCNNDVISVTFVSNYQVSAYVKWISIEKSIVYTSRNVM